MRSIDEQIDAALRLYTSTLAQTMLPAALGAFVGAIPIAMVMADLPRPTTIQVLVAQVDGGAFGLAWLFQLLLNLLVQGVLLKVLALRARNGVVLPVGEALHAGIAMLPAMLLAALLYLALTILLSFLVVPGIWMLVAGMFCAPAVALEGREALDALKRSAALVRGRWWRSCGVLVLAGLAGLVGYMMLALLFGPLADAVFGGGWSTDVVLATVVGALFTPLYNALLLVLFVDYVGDRPGAPAAPPPPPDHIAA